MPPRRSSTFPGEAAEPSGKSFGVILALGEKDRRASRLQRRQHVVEDQGIALLVRGQRGIDLLDRRALLVRVRRQPEPRRAQDRAVPERMPPGLRLRAHPEPDRAALHEHDRMMAVLARDGRRQTEHEFRLRAARDRLEAHRREVVALVDHEMPVARDDVVHLMLPHEALDDADIDDAARLALSAADPPDGRCGKIEERPEPGDPLVHELAAMHENERIGPTRGDDGRGDDRLAKPGRSREHAGLVRQHCPGGGLLLPGQLAEKGGLDGNAGIAFVPQIDADAEVFKQPLHCLAAAARQGHVMREQFGAGDDAGNAEGGAPHSLSAVERRVLEGRETDQPVDQTRRQAGARNVDLVAQNRVDLRRQGSGDLRRRPAPRWRRGPGFLVIVVERQAKAPRPGPDARPRRRSPTPPQGTGAGATTEMPIGQQAA